MIFLVMIFIQTITLSNNPIVRNALKLTKYLSISGDFYRSIDVVFVSTDRICIYDRGNKKINIYNNRGELVNRFGKEGNGPFELNGNEKIVCDDKHIITLDENIISFYSYSGNGIKEIKVHPFADNFFLKNEKIILIYRPNSEKQIITYSRDGEILKQIENPSYPNTDDVPFDYTKDLIKHLKTPFTLTPFKNDFIRYYHGSYKIEILDEKLKNKVFIERKMLRIKKFTVPPKIFFIEETEDSRKAQKSAMAAWKNVTGGYQNDIAGIIGEFKNYLFVLTAYNFRNEINIDVISSDYKLYTTVSLKTNSRIIYSKVRLQSNLLIIPMKDDDKGPFVEIYKVIIN